MGSISEKEFINELTFCLKQEDIVKAKALLQFASDSNVDVNVQKKALSELAKGPEKIVFPLLEYLTRLEISNPEVQESLYELILDMAYGNTDLVIEYIKENTKKTRILFLQAVGDLMLTDTAQALEDIIASDGDKDILVEAIQSLGRLRLPEAISTISLMAVHPDREVKRAAIFAIAETGGTDAVDLLIGFLGDDEETDKLAVESLAEIQDIYSLERLASLLSSPVTIVRDTAIDQLMKLGTKATPILTKAFRNAEADYLVHLVTTLGYIGDPAAVPALLNIINTHPKDANIRQATFEAMERIPSPRTAICLAQGLQDEVEAVRMSAARAIDINLSKPLVAGLKNIIRDESQDSVKAVAALIDSEAGNIFNFLVEEESFQKIAQEHVLNNASPNARKSFLQQLTSLGKKELVKNLTSKIKETPEPEKAEAAIFIIDDSKMMLKLYQNKLSAMGFEPTCFHRPEDAIPQIIKDRPQLVITDLNMPNISGLELTREVRKEFTRKALPILMITTQSDFVESNDGNLKVDDSALSKSGINQVLYKPFRDKDLKNAVTALLKK
ncbi:response regulator [Desulfospira joergensenii]|uniref:response regulator n=1 Tax=Desulfospira joergensenii TaxID=53329 RepID=UPI0003B794AC|nr:response regulator [Desulfospira joergensenii]